MRDLALTADLMTSGGPLQLDAALRRSNGVAHYAGYALTTGLALDSLHASAPPAALTGRIDFDLSGSSLHTLEGDFAVRGDSASVAGMSLAGRVVITHETSDSWVEGWLLLVGW